MPTNPKSEKDRKRRTVAKGVLEGKKPAAIAREIGCTERHARRLQAEPATQMLITELMRPYRVRLSRLVPKAIRAVERGLVAQKTTKSDAGAQLLAVRRAKDLLVLAQGEKQTEQQSTGQVTWEEFQIMYKRRIETREAEHAAA